MILLNFGKSTFNASSLINSTLSIFSFFNRFSNIWQILESCSIAITFLTRLASSIVSVPIPGPISNTISSFVRLPNWII